MLGRRWRGHRSCDRLVLGRWWGTRTCFRLGRRSRRARGRPSGRASRRRGGLLWCRHWPGGHLRRRPGLRWACCRRRFGCRSGWCRSTGRLVARRLCFLRRRNPYGPRRCLRRRLVWRPGRSVLGRWRWRPHRPGALAGRRRRRPAPTWLMRRGRRRRSALTLLAGLATLRPGGRRRPRGTLWSGLPRAAGCLSRGPHPKQQARSMLGIADGDGLAVADVDRWHPSALDVDAVSALVDGDPMVAGEPQHQVDGFGPPAAAIVEADVSAAIVADRDIAARRKRVIRGTNPNGQRGSERLGPHGPPPFITGHIVPIEGYLPASTIMYPTARADGGKHRPALMARCSALAAAPNRRGAGATRSRPRSIAGGPRA